VDTGIQTVTVDQHSFNSTDIGVQANILPDGTSIETTLQVMSQNINNLQLKLDYLTQAYTMKMNSLHIIIPEISAAQAYPDHPSYLIYLAQNPMTNTIMDIIANNYIF
jgi:hypothetical protein